MPETFEELVTRHLPSLYAGARFLVGGAEGAAEELLLDAVATARSKYGTWAWDPCGLERALGEEMLERRRLGRAPEGDRDPRESPRGNGRGRRPALAAVERRLEAVEPQSFYRASRVLPAHARAAIWLVTMERWSYDDTAAALGADREQVMALLAWRDVLIRELLGEAFPFPSRWLSGSRVTL